MKFYWKRMEFHWNWDPVRFVRFQKNLQATYWTAKTSSFVAKALNFRGLHQNLFRWLIFVKDRKASLTCRFLSMHQLVSKSSSSSPKGLISCSATCNWEHRMSLPWCLWRLRVEAGEDSCFTLWFLLSPFTVGSLEQSGSGLINTQVCISQQDWTLRPSIVHPHAWDCSSKSLSIQLVTMQVPSRRSHGLFRNQKTDSQVQISQQISKEFWQYARHFKGCRACALKEFTKAQVMRENVTVGKVIEQRKT